MKPAVRELILYASLALNIVLLGLVVIFPLVTKSSMPMPGAGPGMPPFPPHFDTIAEKLSLTPDQRKEVMAVFANGRDEALDHFNELRETRLRLVRFVIQNPDDKEGIEKILQEDVDTPRRMGSMMAGHLSAVVKILTPEQRVKLLAEFEELEKTANPVMLKIE